MQRVPQVGDFYRVIDAGPDADLIGQVLPIVRVDEDGCNEYSVWLQGSKSSWTIDIDDEEASYALEFHSEAPPLKMDDTRPYLEVITE